MRHICTSIVAMLVLAGTSLAATINVPADYTTIQEAIDVAVDGDVILVDQGTYVEQIDYLGKSISVQSIYGPTKTIIDGQFQGTVVRMVGCQSSTVLDGFTVKRGVGVNGGGMYVSTCETVQILHCDIRVNAANYGAGIYGENSTIVISDSDVKYNETNSSSGYGGGIRLSDSKLIGSGMNILWNQTDGHGGGIYAYGTSEIALSDCHIADNVCGIYGGAIYTGSGVVVDLINCDGSNNHTPSSNYNYGGFVYLGSNSQLSLVSCSFTNCSSGGHGGFAYISQGSIVSIYSTLIGDCQANWGGLTDGVHMDGSSSVFIGGSTFCAMTYDISGDWIDKGGNTFPSTCPEIVDSGACCTNGVCELVTEVDCDEYHGVYYGDGTDCSGVSCPDVTGEWGACCLSQDICIISKEDDCSVAGGVYQGDETICQSSDCSVLPPETGACCLGFGECVATHESECVSADGAFAGIGIVCEDADCLDTCLGDINGDGEVSTNDILTLIANWGPCP